MFSETEMVSISDRNIRFQHKKTEIGPISFFFTTTTNGFTRENLESNLGGYLEPQSPQDQEAFTTGFVSYLHY